MSFLGALTQPIGRLGLRSAHPLGLARLPAAVRGAFPLRSTVRISSVRDDDAIPGAGSSVARRFGVEALVELRLRVAMR
jgi:hypothetical protein